jgi:hypothetical protein
VLFRVNMYRLGREKRLEAQMRIRRLATLATIVTINIVVVGLFMFAVLLSGRGIAAKESRLEATQEAVASLMDEQGGARSTEELELVRTRASQVRWSVVLDVVARLTPADMWFQRLRLTEGALAGSRRRISGLRMSGKLQAGREEEGLSKLMNYVSVLREDPSFKRYFVEPKLLDSSWLSDEGSQFLEFDIFCPIAGADAILEGAAILTRDNPDVIDPADVDGAGGMGVSGESAS